MVQEYGKNFGLKTVFRAGRLTGPMHRQSCMVFFFFSEAKVNKKKYNIFGYKESKSEITSLIDLVNAFWIFINLQDTEKFTI